MGQSGPSWLLHFPSSQPCECGSSCLAAEQPSLLRTHRCFHRLGTPGAGTRPDPCLLQYQPGGHRAGLCEDQALHSPSADTDTVGARRAGGLGGSLPNPGQVWPGSAIHWGQRRWQGPQHCLFLAPKRRLNPGPWRGKRRVPSTGPPGKCPPSTVFFQRFF